MSLPTRLLLQILLTTLLLWWMATTLPQYVGIGDGWAGYAVIAIILVLLNLFVRPILDLLAAPVKFIAGLIGLILVNAVFLWILVTITGKLDPSMASFEIRGGILGWVVVAVVLGIGKMLIHLVTPAKKN
jgi:uncharacterized membrane protein YvlD (DUF360 family)